MGQQPNIEVSYIPSPEAVPAPSRGWTPNRPGDSGSPADVPSGGAFGVVGPDPGYARHLARSKELLLAEGELRHNAEAAVAELGAARAARIGRAPIGEDVDVAALLLGYDSEGVTEQVLTQLAADRPRLIAGLSHSAQRGIALVARVPDEVLVADAAEIRARMSAGERLLAR